MIETVDQACSFMENIDSIEKSQQNIRRLLDKLIENAAKADNSNEVNYLLNTMDSLIGQFSDNQTELHSEITAILNSSKQGLLTHEQLTDM